MATVTAGYWFARVTPPQGGVIVDVGSGDGADLDAYDQAVGPGGTIIAIEPHPVLFAQTVAAARRRQNMTCHRVACAEFAGQLWIEDGLPWEGRTTAEAPSPTHTIPVEGRRLDDILGWYRLTRIHLLKMNIEGAEVAALRAAPVTLAMTTHVVVSAHDFRAAWGEGEQFRTSGPVLELLHTAGFDTQMIGPWNHIHGWRPVCRGDH